MTGEVLQDEETYVSCHQNTATQLISTRPIIDLCLVLEQRPGSRVAKRWLDQDGLYLEGMRTADREAERKGREEETDRTETETD